MRSTMAYLDKQQLQASGDINIGVAGFGQNGVSSPVEIGGYFGLQSSTPSFGSSAALMADNGGELQPVFVARANGVVKDTIDLNGNIGIGTFTGQSSIAVVGNIGIGTVRNGDSFITNSAPNGGMIVEGNVGIGTLAPGTKLDVFGTVRMTGLTMSGQTPSSGQVLMATDSGGDATWSSPGSVAGWTISGTNIYNTNSGNVGINTINGSNVGIGTFIPTKNLHIVSPTGITTLRLDQTAYLSGGNQNADFIFNANGANSLDIETYYGSASNRISLDPGGIMALTALGSGNVGIGTTTPTSRLDSHERQRRHRHMGAKSIL